jgi:hypothetical protein
MILKNKLARFVLIAVAAQLAAFNWSAVATRAATGDLNQSYLNETGSIYSFGEFIVAYGDSVAIADRYGPIASTSGQYDGLVHLYHADSGVRLGSLSGSQTFTQWYGSSLAAYGDRLLIGAIDNANSTHDGYVELHGAGFGAPLRIFRGPAMLRPGTTADYGSAVIGIGNRIIVGDPNAYFDSSGAIRGATYVHDAATGALQRTFANPAEINSYFGTKFADFKGRLVIAGSDSSSTRLEAGTVYLYDLDTGEIVRRFDNPTPVNQGTQEYFGEAVAVAGDMVIVGTPHEQTYGSVAGAVYVFNGDTGQLVPTMHAPRRIAWENFGRSLAVNGHHLLVSNAPWPNGGNDELGAALLYDIRTGVLLHRFADPTPATPNTMAWTVAFATNGDVLAASTDQPGPREGVVYRFEGVPASLGGVGYSSFDEPSNNDASYVRGATSAEMAFTTSVTATGGSNAFAGVANGGEAMSPKMLSHRSLRAVTAFQSLDLTYWRSVAVELEVQVANTTYEAGDFARVSITNGTESIDLLHLLGSNGDDELDQVAGDGFSKYLIQVPDGWQSLRLVIESSTNSTAGSERIDFDNVLITGIMVPEPSTYSLTFMAILVGLLWNPIKKCKQYSKSIG